MLRQAQSDSSSSLFLALDLVGLSRTCMHCPFLRCLCPALIASLLGVDTNALIVNES